MVVVWVSRACIAEGKRIHVSEKRREEERRKGDIIVEDAKAYF